MATLDRLESRGRAQDFPATSGHTAATGFVLEFDQTRRTEGPQARLQIGQDRSRQIEISDERKQSPADLALLKGPPRPRLFGGWRKHEKGNAAGQVGRIGPIIVG